MTSEAFHHVGSHVRRTCHGVERERVKTDRVEQQIDSRDENRTSGEGPRKISLWILYFEADAIEIRPPVVSPKGRGNCGQECRERAATRLHRPERVEVRSASVTKQKASSDNGEYSSNF